MRIRLIAIACVLAAGCSKARPAGGVDAGGDDDPDAREIVDAADTPDAPDHVDAENVIDAPPGTPDAPPPPPDASPPDAPLPPVTLTLTQTTDSTTIQTGAAPGESFSVACANSFGVTAENSYYRAFTLGEHGVIGAFNISQVGIGIEIALDEPPPPNTPAATQPATLRLYTYTGAVATNLDLGQAVQISTVPIAISNNTMQQVVSFAISGTIPANGTFLVELAIPDGDPDDDSYGPHFFIGANSLGQTKGGYVRAAECMVNSPTTFAGVGFADRHIIITATGTYQP